MSGFGFCILIVYSLLLFIRPQEFVSWMLQAPVLKITEIILFSVWLSGKKRFDAPQYFDMGCMVVAIFCSLILVSISNGIEASQNFIIYSVVIFICVANGLTTCSRTDKLFLVIVFATSIMVWHGIDQMFDPDHIGWSGMSAIKRNDNVADTVYQIRYLGFFNDPNDLGMTLVFSIPIIVYFLTQSKGIFKKTVWLAALGFHVYGVYLTNSRGTMLGLVGIAALYGLFRYGGMKAVILAAMAAPVILALAPSRMTVSGDSSSLDRLTAWYEGLKMFQWRPLFGVGKGQFLEHHSKTAHNSWVLAFSELGFIGYYFWLSIVTHSVFQVWWAYRYFAKKVEAGIELTYLEAKEQAIALTLTFSTVGALITAFFLSRTYMVLIYIMAALAVAQLHRMTDQYEDYRLPSIRGKVLGLEVISFIAVYFIIRLAGP